MSEHFPHTAGLFHGFINHQIQVYRSPNSKQGNRYLKWAFSQAACRAVKYYYKRIRTDFERRAAKRKKAAKLVSYSIIAHKLAMAAYHVMKNETPYVELLLFT